MDYDTFMNFWQQRPYTIASKDTINLMSLMYNVYGYRVSLEQMQFKNLLKEPHTGVVEWTSKFGGEVRHNYIMLLLAKDFKAFEEFRDSWEEKNKLDIVLSPSIECSNFKL